MNQMNTGYAFYVNGEIVKICFDTVDHEWYIGPQLFEFISERVPAEGFFIFIGTAEKVNKSISHHYGKIEGVIKELTFEELFEYSKTKNG